MNIQPNKIAVDLRTYNTIPTKCVGQGAIQAYDLSQLCCRQQTRNDRLSTVHRQLKRRREFENIFDGETKKLKLDEHITPVPEADPRNQVEIPMVQIPYNYYRTLAIKAEPLDDLEASNILNILEKSSSLIMQTAAAIKEEPLQVLDTTNNLNVDQSVFEASNPSLKQTVLEKPIVKLNPKNVSNGEDSCFMTSYSSAIGEEPINDFHSSNSSNTRNPRSGSSSPLIIDCFQLGPNGTYITGEQLLNINWTEVSITTRQLLSVIFDRETLATHTLSGKPSPAFLDRDRPLKRQLDKLKVADVIYFLKLLFNCPERVIRNAITMKCADTAKAIRRKCLSKANLDKFL
ncbi:uncharacterized protein [Bactrocera oleae]|uniref:uncharacterized protein n=1 Tax=Bactrocera oleae TaxID=104688 RepID=UPI00387E39C6